MPWKHRDLSRSDLLPAAYRGCSPTRRRPGVARTRPWAVRLVETACERGSGGQLVAPTAATPAAPSSLAQPPPAIELELEDGVWSGVACWAGRAERWVRFTVPIAYDLRYDIVAKPSWAAPQPPRGQPPWGILIVGVVVGIAGNSTTTCQ